MAGKRPFSASLEEELEIKQIAGIIFSGGNPGQLDETKALYIKWKFFFDAFLSGVDRRTGSLLHLPFSGGTCEQPAKTMTIINIIQAEYFKKLPPTL